MAKYRVPPRSSTEQHSALQKRVGKLERNPRAPQTSINNGVLSVRGGEFTCHSNFDISTFNVNVPNFGNNSIDIGRTKVSDNAYSPWAFNFLDIIDAPIPSWQWNDRYGSPVLSDAAHPEAVGLGNPWMGVQFFDPSTSTTFTSSTFTNFRSCFWYPYHPHLRVRTLIQVDASTTGEIRLNEQASGPQDLVQLTAGMFNYVDLICDRRNTSTFLAGNYLNGGGSINLDLEVHRLTGAGNIKVTFVEAIGLDLSFLWDF